MPNRPHNPPGPANPPRLPSGRGFDNGPLLFGDRNSTTGRILNSDIAGAGRGLGLPGYGYDIDGYGVVTSGDILNNLNYFAGGSPSNPLPFYGEIGDWPENIPARVQPHDGVTVPNDAFTRTPPDLLTVGDLLGADPDYFGRGRNAAPRRTDLGDNVAVNSSLNFNQYNPNSRHPGAGEPTDGPVDIHVASNPSPLPSRNTEVPPARDYIPSPGQDRYTWNPYYSDSPGAERYTWDNHYSDLPASDRLPWPDGPTIQLPPTAPELAVMPTGGEPDFIFPPDPNPDLLPSRPPRAGDYFDFAGRDQVAGTNVVPPMNFGDRPMPNLLGFGLGPSVSPWSLGLQEAGVPGGDIYVGGQLAGHTPGSGGESTVDTIPDGADDYAAINAQRQSLGLPPQAPHGPGVSGGGAPMDQTGRFSQNSGTGNFTADQTTNAFVAAGGYAGAPNFTGSTGDAGHTMFSPGGKMGSLLDGVVTPGTSPGAPPPAIKWNLPSQAESAALGLSYNDPASTKRYNDWLAAHNKDNYALLALWGSSRVPGGGG